MRNNLNYLGSGIFRRLGGRPAFLEKCCYYMRLVWYGIALTIAAIMVCPSECSMRISIPVVENSNQYCTFLAFGGDMQHKIMFLSGPRAIISQSPHLPHYYKLKDISLDNPIDKSGQEPVSKRDLLGN